MRFCVSRDSQHRKKIAVTKFVRPPLADPLQRQWVAMDVAAEMEELLFGLDEDGFVDALVEGPYALVFLVEKHRISGAQRVHKTVNRLCATLMHEKVKVVGHQTIR